MGLYITFRHVIVRVQLDKEKGSQCWEKEESLSEDSLYIQI